MAIGLKKTYIIAGSAGALVCAGLVYFGVSYVRISRELSDLKKSKTYATDPKAEIADLLREISRSMELPSTVEPSLATVSDASKLKNQILFTNAQNGDKLLIFADVKKAILYRPSTKKIIDVALLSAPATQSATQQPSVSITNKTGLPQQAKFYLLNGTQTVGLTKSYEKVLVSKVPGATVVDRDNAKNQATKQTLLVDVSGKNSDAARAVGAALSVTLGTLPPGEATPPAGVDFVLIVGEDFK